MKIPILILAAFQKNTASKDAQFISDTVYEAKQLNNARLVLLRESLTASGLSNTQIEIILAKQEQQNYLQGLSNLSTSIPHLTQAYLLLRRLYYDQPQELELYMHIYQFHHHILYLKKTPPSWVAFSISAFLQGKSNS